MGWIGTRCLAQRMVLGEPLINMVAVGFDAWGRCVLMLGRVFQAHGLYIPIPLPSVLCGQLPNA